MIAHGFWAKQAPRRCGQALSSLPDNRVHRPLRPGELRQIVRGDLRLDHKRPHILVRAVTIKNRTEASIPLHREVVAVLNAAKPASAAENAPVFPRCRNADRRIKRDIEQAGIERTDARGRKLVFHSLRYTFTTKLARQGVSQRLAQPVRRR